jgi:hypothetical protein
MQSITGWRHGEASGEVVRLFNSLPLERVDQWQPVRYLEVE